MLCVACGAETAAEPCVACGKPPRLDGRYALLRVIGQGALGTTYAGEGPTGVVAVKEVLLRRVADEKAVELLHREARVLRQLSHPAIPRYVEDLVAGTGKHRAL